MSTAHANEIKLTPELKIAKDVYVGFVNSGFDLRAVAQEFGVDEVSAEFLIRSYQRWMAVNSIVDMGAAEIFDETVAKYPLI